MAKNREEQPQTSKQELLHSELILVDFDLILFWLIFGLTSNLLSFYFYGWFWFLMVFYFGFYFYFYGWFWFWFLFLWLIFAIYWALLGFFFCGFCLRFWYMCWIIWVCFWFDTFLVAGLMALFLCLAIWCEREREREREARERRET